MIRGFIVAALCCGVLAAQAGFKIELVGGTLRGLTGRTAARLDPGGAGSMVFHSAAGELRIPFQSVRILKYGQDVSRRYVEAVLISPLFLLSKSRRHFFTLMFDDAEAQTQALVFRVEQRDVHAVLAILEARTGKRVEYQDEEARKQAGK